MANTMTNIQKTILVRGLDVLRQKAVMPSRVFRGYNVGGAAERGDVINVPTPPTFGTSAVTPDEVPPQAGDQTPAKVQVAVDNWRKSDAFFMTDKEMNQLLDPNAHFIPMNVDASVTALAEYVNAQIMSTYTGIYGYTGTAGTTPFAGTKATNAAQARAVLLKQKAPSGMRSMVIDPDAGALALVNDQLSDFDKIPDSEVRIEGELGRRVGFDWFEDQQVVTHTAGTITTGAIVKASTVHAVGVKSVVCTTAASTGAVALLEGDIISIAGDSQTYVLTADVTEASASTDFTIAIEPGLAVATAGSEAVTVKDSHVVNLAFHRDAFVFVSVPLVTSELSKRTTMSIQDPLTGITLRLEHIDQYKQSHWEFDILFGKSLLRPELACRVAG